MKEDYLGHKERLRKRYQEEGLDGFHDYEVLELILSFSLVQSDTKRIAKKLIERFGSITDVMNASINELTEIKGMGTRTAVLLKVVKDSAAFMMKDKIIKRYYVKSSADVMEYLKHFYRGDKIETFLVIYLNSRNMIISTEPLYQGTTFEARVYIRTVVEKCIKKGASALIIVHNHPSGSKEISAEDMKLTRRVKEILKIIDVRLLDHIIVADKECISLADNKLL